MRQKAHFIKLGAKLDAMKIFRPFFSVLCALCFLVSGCTAQQTSVTELAPLPPAPFPIRPVKHVIIVSFDGGNPDVMQKSAMPVFWRMAQKGASTTKAQTIFPSITLPSHTSMLTGVGPDKHQILWNNYQPDRGVVKVPTMFSVAKKANPKLKTALFAGKEKFKHLDIPGSLDKIEIPASEAKKVAEAAAQYIKSDKPNLMFVHFADSDVVGHKFGWGSPEQMASFADEDAALGFLENAVNDAKIADSTTFILTADHGGHDKTHGTNQPDDMTIPWIAYGASVKPQTALKAPIVTMDSAASALALLGIEVPKDWEGKPAYEAFVKAP